MILVNQMRDKRRQKSWETAKLMRAMEARGLTSATLVNQAGVSLRALQNLLSDCHSGRPLRVRLNQFFGEPIFNLEYQRKIGRPRKPSAIATPIHTPTRLPPAAPVTPAAQSSAIPLPRPTALPLPAKPSGSAHSMAAGADPNQ